MDLQNQLVADLKRRSALLLSEAATWKTATDLNTDGMGIHRSQIQAVNLLLDELQKKQQAILDNLDPALPPATFAQRRADMEQALAGAHGIMSIFRSILAQRSDKENYRTPLDAADLIAADCYLPCMMLAKHWGALSGDQLRMPPLTYLNSAFSPFAITRRQTVAAFKLPLDGYSEEKLPLSVIALPFHFTRAIWTFCTIHHEVGHVLDQDLGLFGSLHDAILARVPARKAIWELWLREIIADALGVLLGGTGFAYALLNLIFRPAEEVARLDPSDRHPNHYVRIRLLCELLDHTGVADMAQAAGEIEQTWKTLYGAPDADLQPFLNDCPAVAEGLLDEKLASLKNHALHELAPAFDPDTGYTPTLAGDQKQVASLAILFRLNFNGPQPNNPRPFPFRLVPAAAQIAVHDVTEKFDETFDAIHRSALAFTAAIKRPEFLGPGAISKEREAYLRGLVQNLDFATLFTPNE